MFVVTILGRVIRRAAAALGLGAVNASALVVAAALAAPLAVAVDAQAQAGQARFLQLGSFRSEANARRVLERFRGSAILTGGARGFVEQRVVNGAVYHRVRIGPIYNDAVAVNALAEARALGVADASLRTDVATGPRVTYDPNLSTANIPPVAGTSGATMRYVMVGAVRDLGAANALLNRARATDAAADGVIHSMTVRGGAIHRVLVGPFSTDAEAARAEARLRALGVLAAAATSTTTTTTTTVVDPSTITTQTVRRTDPATASRMPYLLVGTYRLPSNAYRALERLRRSGIDNGRYGASFLETVVVNGDSLSRVQVGPIDSPQRAAEALALAQNLGYRDARIVAPGAF